MHDPFGERPRLVVPQFMPPRLFIDTPNEDASLRHRMRRFTGEHDIRLEQFGNDDTVDRECIAEGQFSEGNGML